MDIFTIDGKAYNINVMNLRRKASVVDTSNSGRVISGDMNRDIIGTFYNYTLEVRMMGEDYESYNAMYDVITAPVDSHEIVVPYGGEILTFKAYITGAEDTLVIRNGKNLWGYDENLKIDFIAMSPQRR